MKLIYIDEAGNTGSHADPDQPWHLLCAIIVDSENARSVESRILEIAESYFGARAMTREFEFHGVDIRRGTKAFVGLKPAARIAIVNDLISALEDGGIKIGYTVVDKKKSWSVRHPYKVAFQFLLERVQDLLVAQNTHGLIIADENQELEQDLIDDLNRYKRYDTGWGWRPTRIDRVIGAVHFVDSKNDWLMQLADVVTYFLLRGKRTEERLRTQFLEQVAPPPPNYPDWLKGTASPAEKIDIGFYERLTNLTRLQFSKIFPT